ncbi:hypothetical protein CHELA1G11_20631 [Hyphomicrobiales bacterium]|nr:hypothetical protein CHELA1G11_20631 [Hyphomicrobiales bacterium]CAH1691148.1 hypothetical protein CHELA1G2_20945 [Hyphomicrobiales bacterium]
MSAERVKEAEARCARQREFIGELRASNLPTAMAEAILGPYARSCYKPSPSENRLS